MLELAKKFCSNSGGYGMVSKIKKQKIKRSKLY
jgi:hypothetical protein